jgi:hypothetical protein
LLRRTDGLDGFAVDHRPVVGPPSHPSHVRRAHTAGRAGRDHAPRASTPPRVPRMRMSTWPRPRPRGALHSLVSRSLSSAVKGTNRNALPFLLCALPVSPLWPLPRALLRPSSCPPLLVLVSSWRSSTPRRSCFPELARAPPRR